jgi:small subunit ribosomal protein S20
MPIKKAALKRMRADKKIHTRKMRIMNDLRTGIKNLRELLKDKKKNEAAALLPKLSSRLNKAAQKKIIHTNKASRTISRLEKALRKLSAA